MMRAERWKFVKRDRAGNPVIVTQYDAADLVSDQMLNSLRRFDLSAIREHGCSWEKVPADQFVEVQSVAPTKEWDSPWMRGELRTNELDPPSPREFARRMAKHGVGPEEAEELRRFMEDL